MTKRKNKNKNKTIQPIQNDVGQLSFNFTLVLQKQEQLIKENQELRNQLEHMTGQRDILIKQLSDRDKTIAELIEENKQLKDRIKNLEDRIKKIETENSQLKNDISNIHKKELVNKLIIAIQDLNAHDLLEKQLDKPYDLAMKRIHYERISGCHFINNNSDDTIIYAKKYVLCELLENAPVDVKSRINTLVLQQDFVEHIILYLKNTVNIKPSEKYYDYARVWFDI